MVVFFEHDDDCQNHINQDPDGRPCFKIVKNPPVHDIAFHGFFTVPCL